MIGDTPYDPEAASGAGTAAAGLLSGGFPREALTGAGCFTVAQELRDLLPCLENALPRVTNRRSAVVVRMKIKRVAGVK
jgi:hypothetical protein